MTLAFALGISFVPSAYTAELGLTAAPAGDAYYAAWLAAAEPLLSPAERQVFASLTQDAQRELFIRRFWQVRAGTSEDIEDSDLEDSWHRRMTAALQRFGTLAVDPAQVVLLLGEPARVWSFETCRDVLSAWEIWYYDPWTLKQQLGTEEDLGWYLLFASRGAALRQWSPKDGFKPLLGSTGGRRAWSRERLLAFRREQGCLPPDPGAARALTRALEEALGPPQLQSRAAGAAPDPSWLDALGEELTSLEDVTAAAARGVTYDVLFAGRYEGKTVVQLRFAVPESLLAHEESGQIFDQVVLEGEVWSARQWIDGFRTVHYVTGSQPSEHVQVEATRLLYPGVYSVRLDVRDGKGLALLREVLRLEVPELAEDAPPRVAAAFEVDGRSRVNLPSVQAFLDFPSLELLRPGEGLLTGTVEVEARTTGSAIDSVEFRLNGQSAGRLESAPWSLPLDLGATPRLHEVEALAYDAAGEVVARDALRLNAGPHRFEVRLVEPAPGSDARRARALIEVPEGKRLERLEIYFNDALLATLEAPPWVLSLPGRRPGEIAYVRAVGWLESGESREDLVLVGSPYAHDEIEVQAIELYTTVVDAEGRLVADLEADDFLIYEDGEPQVLHRFATLEELPIHVALLLDVSTSMTRRLPIAVEGARSFFQTVLTPKDRAAVLTCHHEARLAVPFTNDLERLWWGTADLSAWGATELHDCLAYACHYFGGVEGKRALILITDGRDQHSELTFEQIQELALRSGVALYPIVLRRPGQDPHNRLQTLAEATGGRYFAIREAGELDAVYRTIEEELRSQYLLVYQSPRGPAPGTFRKVEVHVDRPGLTARTLRGYYP